MHPFAVLAAIFGGLGAIWTVVHYFAEDADAAFRRELAERLLKPQAVATFRRPLLAFRFAADRFFGTRLASPRALLRSAILSLVFITALTLLLQAQVLLPTFASISTAIREWASALFLNRRLAVPLWTSIGITMLIDFIAVCLTRTLIRVAASTSRVSTALLIVVLDAVLSVLLFSVLYLLFLYIFQQHRFENTISIFARPQFWHQLYLPMEIGQIPPGLATWDRTLPFGLLALSSLLTSIWMWFYAVGLLTLLLLERGDRFTRRFLALLDPDSSPFKRLSVLIAVALLGVGMSTTVVSAIWYYLLRPGAA